MCLCPSQDRTMHRVVPSEPCPELNCAESEQIALSDRCCKVCRGMEEKTSYSTRLLSAISLSLSVCRPPPSPLNLFVSVPPAGHDFCSEGHSCMEHSDCVNLEAGDCCVCKDGFRPLRDDNAYCEGTA